MYKIINRRKLIFTQAADIVGRALCTPFKFFNKTLAIDPQAVKSILIIRTAYIGDAIMTIPIIKPLKEHFPNAQISFLTSEGGAQALANNPHLDEILTYNPFWFYNSAKVKYLSFLKEIRKHSFDLVIEARADIREILLIATPIRAKHTVSYGVGGGGYLLTDVVPYENLKHKVQYHLDIARHLGADVNSIDWAIYPTYVEKERVAQILKDNKIKTPFVVLHPGARLPLKRWFTEQYAKLYDTLIDKLKIYPVIAASKDDVRLVGEIVSQMTHKVANLTGRLNIREFAWVLKQSEFFICNDSAPLHVASAMKVPTVAIFGPSKSIETGPYGNIHRVVEKSEFRCRYKCDENSCHIGHYHACMKSITVEDVVNSVESLLRELGVGRQNA
ncbi:MAG: glycosyltransferase family 9 protein [Nitrospirae bacterium]|nr:glycosyltransferase family 9 protein [Nitrospirota bacterium]